MSMPTKPTQETKSNKRPEPTLRTAGRKRRRPTPETGPDHWRLPPSLDKHPDDRGFTEYMEHNHSNLPLGESSDGRRKSPEFAIEPDNKQPETRKSSSSRTNKIEGGERPHTIGGDIMQGGRNYFPLSIRSGDIINTKVDRMNLGRVGSKEERDKTRVGRKSDALVTQSEDELDEEEDPTPRQASGGTLPDPWYDNYKKMNDKDKWVLASGRRVENVIQEAREKTGREEFASSPAQLFILDTSDPVAEGWFSSDEWKEITSKLSPLPEADKTLLHLFERFYPVRTTTMLRKILKSGLIPGNATYDNNLHFNLQWAEMVLLKFLILFEAPNNPLTQPHNEGWYGFNIWSQILDTCLLDLQGLTLERKEITCLATAQRRNLQRNNPTGRVKIGHRLDGIIRTLGNAYHEFGGIEDGVTFRGGVTGKKWQSDQLKLIKCMRDMFKRLDDLVNSDPTIKRRIQIVGISTAGLALQYILLGHPGHGHVCLLQKGKVVDVPRDVEELPDLLGMLVMVAQLKQLIKVSFEAVNQRHRVQSQESFNQGLDSGNASSQSRTKLGWSPPSP